MQVWSRASEIGTINRPCSPRGEAAGSASPPSNEFGAEILDWEERGYWYTPTDADLDVEGVLLSADNVQPDWMIDRCPFRCPLGACLCICIMVTELVVSTASGRCAVGKLLSPYGMPFANAGAAPEMHEDYLAPPSAGAGDSAGGAVGGGTSRRGALAEPPQGTYPAPTLRVIARNFQVGTCNAGNFLQLESDAV